MSCIEARGLRKAFGTTIALDGIDLHVEEGHILGLIGPNGAGKTTTMRLLTGILDPTGGEAHVYGKDVVKEAEELKEYIAYMSQRFGLYEELSVLENINFYADVYGVPQEKREQDIDRLLGFLGCCLLNSALPVNFPGG